MQRFIISALLAVSLSACASTPLNYQPRTTQISFPALNTETRVTLGEDMLHQGTMTEVQGISFATDNNNHNFLLSSGFYPQIGEDEEYTYHSFQVGRGMTGLGGITLTGGALFGQTSYPQSIRASRTQRESCVIVGGLGGGPVCDTEHAFIRETRPFMSESSFQQMLIYSGRVGDRIKIGYRESSGNMARPAFANEAEYDLSASDEIAYRGARIRVIDANNEGITYIVLSNFNDTN